jgi:hypothetical protein
LGIIVVSLLPPIIDITRQTLLKTTNEPT